MAGDPTETKQKFITETAMRIVAASCSRKESVGDPFAIERAKLLAEELQKRSLHPW